MAKKTATEATGSNQGKGGLGLGVAMLGFVAAVIIIPAVAALLMVGLAPTIVSWLANQSPNRKNQVLTVLAFNLAGVMPYLFKVLQSPRGWNAVMDIFGNVFSWLVMYGAASAAMLILLAAPQAAAVVLQMMAHDRLASIATFQARLVDEWGEAVSGQTQAE